MKRIYIAPRTNVFHVEASRLLAISGPEVHTTQEPVDPAKEGLVKSTRNLWDEEW